MEKLLLTAEQKELLGDGEEIAVILNDGATVVLSECVSEDGYNIDLYDVDGGEIDGGLYTGLSAQGAFVCRPSFKEKDSVMFSLLRGNERISFNSLDELEVYLSYQNPLFMRMFKPQLESQNLKWNGAFGKKLRVALMQEEANITIRL